MDLLNITGSVLFSAAVSTVKDLLIAAIKSGANLSRANLSGANLSGANLSGASLSRADLSGANLSGASLSRANLSGANLSRANLSEASLSGANLSGANLYGASLSRANLYGANLYGASLSRANEINRNTTTPLYGMLQQPGWIYNYKVVTDELTGPHFTGITYSIGSIVKADADESDKQCSYGINLASLDWVCREWQPTYRILMVKHLAKDVAAIPLGTDGKYRVRRCKVVKELDLVQLGLVAKPEVAA